MHGAAAKPAFLAVHGRVGVMVMIFTRVVW